MIVQNHLPLPLFPSPSWLMYEVKKSYICQQVPSSLSGIYIPAVLYNLFPGEPLRYLLLGTLRNHGSWYKLQPHYFSQWQTK